MEFYDNISKYERRNYKPENCAKMMQKVIYILNQANNIFPVEKMLHRESKYGI